MGKNNNKKNKASASDLSQGEVKVLAASPLRAKFHKLAGSEFRHGWIFVIIVLVFMMGFSVKIGVDQYRGWYQDPSYYAKGVPLMTMQDAYYWLKIAKDYKDGTSNATFTQVPMISLLVAKLSFFFNDNLHKTAIYLTIILPGLFVIPLFLYFYRAGAPAAGILGGLIATVSPAYQTRSFVGWYTTDIMNLFFPFLAALFILLAANKKKTYTYIYSALTGLTILLFHWWYPKPGFTTVYFFVLLAFLLVNNVEMKTVFYSALIYIIIANPVHFWQGIIYISGFFSNYIFKLVEAGELVFPQTIKTISEVTRRPFMEILVFISPKPFFLYGLAGVLLFVLFVLYEWKKVIPLMPVFLLGAFTFISSNRFAMYLTPFVGIGYGYLISMIFDRLFRKTKANSLMKIIAACVVSIAVFFILALKAPAYSKPPAVSSGLYTALMFFKDTLPKDSTIFTWWDIGYAIQEAAGFTVLHDGGSQHSVKTNLIARGFVSDSQKELYNIISLTTRKDNSVLDGVLTRAMTHKELIDALRAYKSPPESDNVFLLFTNDLVGLKDPEEKFASISFLGGWGESFLSNKFEPLGAALVNCKFSGEDLIKCDHNEIDRARGLINKSLLIKKIIYVVNGNIYDEERYNIPKEGYYVEMFGEKINNTLHIYAIKAMHENSYNSNINQIYLLGNYDRNRFEEVYNSFPYVRLFRVKIKR